MPTPQRNRTPPTRRSGLRARKRKPLLKLSRGALVAGALVLALGLTASMLAVLSPAPLQPDVSGRLVATSESPRSLEFAPAMKTRIPVQPGRWTAIYVRHSNTPEGSAATLAEHARLRGISGPPDHFVIGNGRGMADGEVQFTARWNEQAPAASPEVGIRIDPGWISVCLIGDFDRQPPTPAQRERLAALVAALGGPLSLTEDHVVRLNYHDSAAGSGELFLAAN